MDEFQKKNGLSPIRTFADDLKTAQEKTDGPIKQPEAKDAQTADKLKDNTEQKPTTEKEREDINLKSEENSSLVSDKKTLTPIRPKAPKKSASDFLDTEKGKDDATKDKTSEPNESDEEEEKEKKSVTIPTSSLEKEINDIATLSGTVRLEDDGVSLTDDDISEGKFVQDRKVRRHKLFPSLAHATKDWAENKKEALEEIRKPEYTTEDPEKRVNTIKAASKNSKRMPQEDFDMVVEKFKNVERKPTESSIRLKDRDEVVIPEPTWSSSQEGEEVKEDTEVTTTKTNTPQRETETEEEKTENIEATQTEPAETAETKTKVEETTPLPQTKETEEVTPSKEKEISSQVEKEETEATEEPEAKEKEKVSEPETEEAEIVKTETTATENSAPTQNKPSFLSRFSLTKIPVYAIVVVIIVACLAGIATSAFFLLGNNSEPEMVQQEPMEVSPFGNNTVDSTFVTNKDALVRTMSTKSMSGEGLRTVRFVNKEGEEVPSLNAGLIILEESGIRLLERAVDSMTFGFTENDEHFIVLTGADFDTAFAGMLAWEETLSGDLAPLFGENNKRNFVDTAYGSNDNRTARVLLAQNNEPQMAYTVLGSGTIIISTNLVELTKIESIIRQQ